MENCLDELIGIDRLSMPFLLTFYCSCPHGKMGIEWGRIIFSAAAVLCTAGRVRRPSRHEQPHNL